MLAFSDGVIAILITILVLELRPPEGDHLADILDEKSKLLAYVLSFVMVGIYWNNHHHLFQIVETVDGRTMWANMHLLFWLSLVPFATGWMGDNHFAPVPTALYGALLLLAAIAYTILLRAILRSEGEDFKGKISIVLYAAALFLAFVHPAIAQAIYAVVAAIWLIPDRRIERALAENEARGRAAGR